MFQSQKPGKPDPRVTELASARRVDGVRRRRSEKCSVRSAVEDFLEAMRADLEASTSFQCIPVLVFGGIVPSGAHREHTGHRLSSLG